MPDLSRVPKASVFRSDCRRRIPSDPSPLTELTAKFVYVSHTLKTLVHFKAHSRGLSWTLGNTIDQLWDTAKSGKLTVVRQVPMWPFLSIVQQ